MSDMTDDASVYAELGCSQRLPFVLAQDWRSR